MTITLMLEPELEFRLKHEADRRGLPPEKYAVEVLEQHVTVAPSAQERAAKLRELFKQWEQEDIHATDEVDEQFLRNLRENRVNLPEISVPE